MPLSDKDILLKHKKPDYKLVSNRILEIVLSLSDKDIRALKGIDYYKIIN